MAKEIQLALRSLARRPAFVVAAVLTLGLGIGGNAVVFSLVDGLLLRPLPFGEATPRIVSLHAIHPTQSAEQWDDAEISFHEIEDIRRESRTIEDTAGHFSRSFTLYGEETSRALGGSVTPNLFSLLGVEPALGRGFREDEGAPPGFESVVILSHGLWQSRFGGDPAIVGRPILVNERELLVVGIMPPGFRFPEHSELWVPYRARTEAGALVRSSRGLLGVARLRSDTSLAEARLELASIAERLEERYPESNERWSFQAIPYRDLLVTRPMRSVVQMLLAAVALVLLVGCANLASLLLARGADRRRELALRAALGAGRARIVRETIVETLLLGVLGGTLGALAAVWSLDAILATFPGELPYWLAFEIDARVLAFVAAISLTTAVAVGLLPALRSARVDLVSDLGNARGGSTSRDTLRAQSWLVATQIAVSFALIVGASLMIRSSLELLTADAGFDETNLLTFRIYLAGDAYDPNPEKLAFYRDVRASLERLPSIEAAAVTTSIPADDGGRRAALVTAEDPVADGDEIGVHVIGVLPRFFDTIGVRVDGRDFEPRDLEDGAAPVAVLNQALAERLASGGSRDALRVGLVGADGIDWLNVIGTAPNIQYEEFSEETQASRLNVYVPYTRMPHRGMAVLARTSGDPGAAADDVRAALRRIAPGAPAYAFRTMEDVRLVTTWEQRLFSKMFGAFALMAFLLACLGIYGVTSYHAGSRTREIGIRLAVGASRRNVTRMLLGGGARLAAAGLGVGIPLALVAGKSLSAVLYRVPPFDLGLYAGASLLLGGSVLLACLVPARRAARVEPMIVLREE